MSKTKKPACTKAVAYIRVSTGKQQISPEAQEAKIRQYAQLKGLELVEVIVETVSASKQLSKRPEGSKIAQLTAAGVCHIVATKLDRIFRSVPDASNQAEAWQAAGISLHCVDDQIDTSTPMGRCFFHIVAALGQMERELIAERTQTALTHLKDSGEVYNHVPYGSVAKGGKLISNPAEQATIAKMQALQAEGLSYIKIADKLNELGIQAKQGGKWGAKAVWNVLKRAQQVAEPAQSAEQLGEQLDQQMRYGQAEQPQVAQFLGYDKQEA